MSSKDYSNSSRNADDHGVGTDGAHHPRSGPARPPVPEACRQLPAATSSVASSVPSLEEEVARHFAQLSRSSDPVILFKQLGLSRYEENGISIFTSITGKAWQPGRDECMAILRCLFGISFGTLSGWFKMGKGGIYKAHLRGLKSVLRYIKGGGE